jgi:hypothetical protein
MVDNGSLAGDLLADYLEHLYMSKGVIVHLDGCPLPQVALMLFIQLVISTFIQMALAPIG